MHPIDFMLYFFKQLETKKYVYNIPTHLSHFFNFFILKYILILIF